ncbi:hypothetical protein BK809_0002667 [Diplodia seriata]|uniref:Uncharacterized protein n=1 Tax=Diplodia seriata TaxID=420778 RepID=A0A1S8B2Q5_9PEZI|nr:hypothetical protein BK809_0002667 [Diplodia seriata]
MSWEEYVQNKGAPTPPVHYAIELLMEDPVIRDVRDHSMPPRPKKGRIQSKRDKRGKGASKPKDTSPSGDPEMKQLPERIRIHSSYLKQLLASVSGGQLSQPPDAPLVMRRPFKFLLYEEETLRQHLSELEETVSEPGDQAEAGETSSADELTLSYLLLEFLDLYVKPTQQQVIQKQSVYFHELWFLYQPGQLLYSRAKNYPQRVWKVVQVTGGNRFLRRYEPDDDAIEYKHSKTDTFGPLSLDCFFLAFDGVGFQPAYRRLEISHFHGLRDMSDLQIIPLEVAELRELINKEDLLLPRERYLECLDGSYMFYRGWTVDKDSLGTQLVSAESHPILPESIESEVMIDLRRAFRLNPQWIPELAILPEHQANPREFEGHYTWKPEPIAEDIHWDILRKEDVVEMMNHQGKDHAWARCEISGEDLFLLPARAPAFVFSSRSWSDLGLDPVQAEANMLRYFDLAQAWDCILLLDEADVFLASRRAGDLQGNALVSVFLRLLEYYRGVLFMTTNRVGSIDEAFKSRIQMSLYYPPLTSDQTMRIWKIQIRKAQENLRGMIEDEEGLLNAAHQIWKDQGSSKRWNGREIHNAFAAAISLARFNKKPLVPEHLTTVADASAVFDEYLWKVHSSSDSQIMRRQMIRADDFEPRRLASMPEEYSRLYDPHMMPGASSLPRMSAQRAQAGDPDASSSPLTGDDTYNNQYPHEHRELPVATSSQRIHAQRARMEDFNPGGYPPIRNDSHYSQYRHEQASGQHQPFFSRPPSGQFHPSQSMITSGQYQPSYPTATPGHPTSAAPGPSYYTQQPYQNTHWTPQQHPVHTAQPAPMQYGWSTAGPRMPPSPQSQPPTTVTSSMPAQNINPYQ